MVTTQLKVLVWDIETAPGEAYFFHPKMRFIPHHMVKEVPFMVCWSAAWLHGGGVQSDCITVQEASDRSDARVVDSVATLLREADIVLAHNGDNFDIPWVRGRAWVNDLEPLGPIQSIDTKKLSARDFYLPHNNLDALAKVKGHSGKTKTDFSWWAEIVEHNPEQQEKALRRMLRYNKKDVRILRDIFKTMLPHVNRLPRLVDSNEGIICPFCGSKNLQKRGIKRTSAYNYQRYQCNQCKRYPSFATNDGSNQNRLRVT